MGIKTTQLADFQRLKIFRKSLRLTQKEFAEALSIAQGSYSEVERGKKSISYNLIKKLVEIFNINPSWLIIGIGDMSESNKIANRDDGGYPKENDHLNDYLNDHLLEELPSSVVEEPPIEFNTDETMKDRSEASKWMKLYQLSQSELAIQSEKLRLLNEMLHAFRMEAKFAEDQQDKGSSRMTG